MKSRSIFLTGSSGFVGKNFIKYFKKSFSITEYKRGEEIKISERIVVHLAGKAHDLKNTSNPNEYYSVNTELTIEIFERFLQSNAEIFIFLSSVKAVSDSVSGTLYEDCLPQPKTHYGRSKLKAENYVLSKIPYTKKKIFIIRPCMIHGPGNKGNLNLLYKWTKHGLPWILGAFENKRSYCSIDNLLFVINQLISQSNISSGIYNMADNTPLSTIEVIRLLNQEQGKSTFVWPISKYLISFFCKIGDKFDLYINSENLSKLTDSYIVSNTKILRAINKDLPVDSKEGLILTIQSFLNEKKHFK